MSLRNRIFYRINLLICLLIIAICVAGSWFEIKHRQHDTLLSIEHRIAMLAEAIPPLLMLEEKDHLIGMLQRFSNFHPAIKSTYIENNQQVFLSDSTTKIAPLFVGPQDKETHDILIREFQDGTGKSFIDVAAPLGGSSYYILHTVVEKIGLDSEISFALKIIFGMGLVTFFFSIPLAFSIANRTTQEISILTTQLEQHSQNLEVLVKERTATLERFKNIVSVTTDHMSFLDTNYIYREVNNSYLVGFGKTREEIVGKSIAQVHGAEVFQTNIKENFDKCLSGEQINYTAWFDFPGFGLCFMDVSYYPFKDNDGTLSGVVVCSRDITEIRQAANLLRDSEERFRALFDGVSSGVAIYKAVDEGQNFVFLDYNQAGQNMDGTPRAEAVGKRVTEVFPGVEEFGMLDVLRRVWKSGTPEEHPVSVYKDRKLSFWRQNYVFKLPSGELVSVYTDETSRMQDQEELHAQHTRFEAVLNSLDAAVYVADMDTHELLFANKQVRDQFGDCTGRKCWQAIQVGQTGPCDFCTNDRLLDDAGQPKAPYIWEAQNTVDKNWYQCRDQAIKWPDGRLVRLEIATNITDRKLSEDASRQQGRLLKSLTDATQVLLASAQAVPYQGFIDLVGPASIATRACVHMNNQPTDGELSFEQKAMWYADPDKTSINELLLQDCSYQKTIPNWYTTLSKGIVFTCTLNDCPEPEKQMLADQQIHSVFIVPIMIDTQFVGFIGFENTAPDTTWSPMEQTYLEAAAFDLAKAIKRSRSEKKIRESLKEKEVLLREIHHRVKNNMQVVTSLLNLQARKITDEKALQAIRESQDRIHVMSLVHETLYRSDDLHSITMKQYFTRLTDDIAKLYPATVHCQVEADNVTLSINDAIPVGLIANELITNAFKHAFTDGRQGEIRVTLGQKPNGSMELVVADNGVGISDDIDLLESKTLGLQLVSRLASGQLAGTFEVVRKQGTSFHVCFTSPRES